RNLSVAMMGVVLRHNPGLWLWVPDRASLVRDDSEFEVSSDSTVKQQSGHNRPHSRGTKCPSDASSVTPENRGRRECGARSHPQPCVQWKKARKQVTTGTPKRSGIPRAMV